MNNTAVVPGLVSGDVTFLLDDDNVHFREAPGGFQGGRQSNDSGADNQEICCTVSHNDSRCPIDTRLYEAVTAAAMTGITRVAAMLAGQ